MADEAVLMIETHLPISMTCSNTTGIEKGTVLVLSDPYTVAATATANDIVGGIAAGEKIANDGKTKLAVYRGGIFKMTGSGNITVGDPVRTCSVVGGCNKVETASVNDEHILGIALETSTNGETLLVELRPTTMQLA
jgi:hypothetical protein